MTIILENTEEGGLAIFDLCYGNISLYKLHSSELFLQAKIQGFLFSLNILSTSVQFYHSLVQIQKKARWPLKN